MIKLSMPIHSATQDASPRPGPPAPMLVTSRLTGGGPVLALAAG